MIKGFIKASDRLPNMPNNHELHYRLNGVKCIGQFYDKNGEGEICFHVFGGEGFADYDINKSDFDRLEWLDESPADGEAVIQAIRKAFAKYYESEGCSCCRNESKHTEAEKELAMLLNAELYEDGSGYDWSKFLTAPEGV